MSSAQAGRPQADAPEQGRPLTEAERQRFRALKAELARPPVSDLPAQPGKRHDAARVGAQEQDGATLAWETEDGRRGWGFSDAQREEILRRRAQGEDFTLGPEGEIIFYPRRSTDPRWWMRGPDDPNVKAARGARDRFLAFRRRPQAATTLPAAPRRPRRTPLARPAARRSAPRRTSTRAGPSADDDGPGERPSEPRRAGESRHISNALAGFLAERRPADAPPLIAYVRDPEYGLINLPLAAFLRGSEI